MSDALATGTWAAVCGRLGGPISGPDLVMGSLAAFRADPSASTWYGFVARFALLVAEPEVRASVLPGDCPYPGVTAQALAAADEALATLARTDPS